MKFINIESLIERQNQIKQDYQSKKPFRYTSFDSFFLNEKAEDIYNNYPQVGNESWNGTTYIDQKNKFTKDKFDEGSLLDQVFKELNSSEFLKWLNEITEIEDELLGDQELFGGGLHQSINGAFLNVHVDYNIHPTTKYHRRLNTIIYMNKDWKDEYEGHIELWDFTDGKKELLNKIAPLFNRCVIFETNEISFHGHPKPLNTPKGLNRKSLATYYYTKTRPENEIASDHNTIYVNTEGTTGTLKRIKSGFKALIERVKK
jgi:Rps23 Pro-64 3,4-dihydroxylase Tpa1-like proline 4-hydroxylase